MTKENSLNRPRNVRYSENSNPASRVLMLHAGQWLRHKIRQHFLHRQVFESDLPGPDWTPGVLILYLDVFGTIMNPCKKNPPPIVNINHHCIVSRNTKPFNNSTIHLDSFATWQRATYILGLCRRKGDASLLLQFPTNGTTTNLDDISSNRATIIAITTQSVLVSPENRESSSPSLRCHPLVPLRYRKTRFAASQ